MSQRMNLWCLCLGTIFASACAADEAQSCIEDRSGVCREDDGELATSDQALGSRHHHHKRIFEVSASVQPEGLGTVALTSRSHRVHCEGTRCEVGYGATVSLQATPADQYHFVRWSGCSDSTESQISLWFIREDTTCEAHFAPNFVTVSAFVVGMYRGTVFISAPGTSCSSQTCTVPYGTPVTLVPRMSESYRFIGWGSCSDSTDPVLVISTETEQRDIQCLAIMEPITVEVSWSIASEGGGSVRGGGGPDIVCGESSCAVVLGGTLHLSATPDEGYRFAGWSGCSDSTDPYLSLPDVREPNHCEAHFEPALPALPITP